MLAEDPVVQLLLGALDEVLAPIISVLDCFDAYLDPRLAPLDFVDYMSSWLLVSQVEYGGKKPAERHLPPRYHDQGGEGLRKALRNASIRSLASRFL